MQKKNKENRSQVRIAVEEISVLAADEFENLHGLLFDPGLVILEGLDFVLILLADLLRFVEVLFEKLGLKGLLLDRLLQLIVLSPDGQILALPSLGLCPVAPLINDALVEISSLSINGAITRLPRLHSPFQGIYLQFHLFLEIFEQGLLRYRLLLPLKMLTLELFELKLKLLAHLAGLLQYRSIHVQTHLYSPVRPFLIIVFDGVYARAALLNDRGCPHLHVLIVLLSRSALVGRFIQ